MPSNHLILCRPLLLLPSVFPGISVFSSESAFHIRWPKYWSFSFNISPSNEYSGLISFRMDWLDLLAVQGTLKSLLQHHSSAVSPCFHGCPAFLHRHFPPQSPSHPLNLSLHSQQQPSPWDCSTIPKVQFPVAAPSRGSMSLSGVHMAAARTV